MANYADERDEWGEIGPERECLDCGDGIEWDEDYCQVCADAREVEEFDA